MATSFVSRCLTGAATFVLGTAASTGLAQATAHYSPGIEGIKGATLPPPGLYLRDYNQFYTSDRLNDNNGDKIEGIDFNTFAYAQVPRLVWITDAQVLGGNIGVDGLWPIVYQDVSVGEMSGSNWGFGDPFAEVTWSAHPKQFDFSLGAGEWFPVQDLGMHNGFPPAGQGFWTTMLTAGVTWYIDSDKTWAVSALNRYEFNHENVAAVTPGQAYTLEWGVSKSVIKTVDLGVVGYFQHEITPASGSIPADLNGVAAIGPEVVVTFPDQSLFVSLRWNYEFWSVNRAQGNNIVLTATYRF